MEVVYALHWRIPDKYYIGKTNSLKRRAEEHLKLLSEGKHYNSKLQDAYNAYGNPETVLLETCETPEVFDREAYWISKYNSVINGYNLIGGNKTQESVCESTTMLTTPDTTIKCKLILVDKNDNFHYVNNIAEFCRNNTELSPTWKNAATSISKLSRGVLDYYKGFRVYKGADTLPNKTKYSYKIYKLGVYITTTNNISEFCRNEPDLKEYWKQNADCLSKVANGVRKQHMGYTCEKIAD